MQLPELCELAVALVATAPVIAYDIETTGLELDAEVVGYAVADAHRALYIPVRHASHNVEEPEKFELALKHAFNTRTRLGLKTVGFNVGFDLFHSGRYGICPGAPLEDAQINEVLIYEYHRAYDLGACCERRGLPGKDETELLRELQSRFGGSRTRRVQMRNFWRLPGTHPLVWSYASGDARATYDLWAAQQGELFEPDAFGYTLHEVHRVEHALIPHLARMRIKGIRVDTAYAEQACDQIDRDITQARVGFPQDFNAARTKLLHQWMTDQGAPSPYQTKLGKPSYTARILEGSDPGRQVLHLRQLEKTRSAFLAPMLGRDRIHPELKQMSDGEYGVKFGRFSCVGPNLQAFPKRNYNLASKVRPVLIPDKGMDFYEADYSQQEPRLYAHFANCERLLTGYNSTPVIDVHTLASQIMGIDRNHAKTLGLSIFNGMTPKTLAVRLDVDEGRARDLYNGFFQTFPEIRRFRDDAAYVAQRRGYVRTILGRRQHFPDNLSTHVAVSRIIQGSAGDHMKVRLLDMLEWVAAAYVPVDVLMTIHDAVIWQAETGAGLNEIRQLLENNGPPLNLKTPMPVEISCGSNWAEASWPQHKLEQAA